MTEPVAMAQEWVHETGHELPEDVLRDELERTFGLEPMDADYLVFVAARLRNGRVAAGASDQGEKQEAAALGALRIVPIDEFAAVDEASAEPLLGEPDEALIAAGSLTVIYGDGGAGKTTLAIDAAAHLGSGAPWLDFPVTRPVRILLLENEGPRGLFRKKLRRKAAGWEGEPYAANVVVLEEPWARASFAHRTLRGELAAAIEQLGIDLLIAGPVKRLGMKGGGTPDDVSAFHDLITELRSAVPRPLAIVLVHHENKAGGVSGAWTGDPDTLIHVRPDSRERITLRIEKARWASSAHGSKLVVRWAGVDSFEVVERDGEHTAVARAAEEQDALDWILAHVEQHFATNGNGVARGRVEDAYHTAHDGHGRNLARRVIDSQIEAHKAALKGESTGEGSYVLATGPGEVKNGTYLYPASHAPSPLAATPNGEGGEDAADPPVEGPPRHLAARPKGGEGGVARGGEGDDDEPDEAEIERLAALAREVENTPQNVEARAVDEAEVAPAETPRAGAGGREAAP